MKENIKMIIGVLVVLVALSVCKDLVVKVAVEKGVEIVTGLKLSTRSFNVGILNGVVSIKGLRLFNPKGFEDPVMIDMPEIYVHYDLPAILTGKLHFQQVRINLKDFIVVKNEKGELNLDSLNVVKAQKEGKKTEAKAGMPGIQIDKLQLKIGKAMYKDYSGGGKPSVREFNVNLDETYTNIRNPYVLVSLIVVRTLSNTTIASLSNFDINGLSGTISDTLSSVGKAATDAVGAAGQTVQKTAEETVKKTADTLEGILKSPFGSSNK